MSDEQRTFLDEFVEVAEDLTLERAGRIHRTEREVAARLIDYVSELIQGSTEPNEMIRNLASGMMVMFMAGRDHAARGYADPIGRHDPDIDDVVSDSTIKRFFEENE